MANADTPRGEGTPGVETLIKTCLSDGAQVERITLTARADEMTIEIKIGETARTYTFSDRAHGYKLVKTESPDPYFDQLVHGSIQ